MNKLDLVFMSVRSLWRRKLRSALTILGVLIGTSSIVLMVSLALAMNQNYENQINQWGALTLIHVTEQSDMDSLVEVEELDDDAITMFESLPYVEKVMPRIETSMTVTVGGYGTMREVTIIGYDAEELTALGYEATEGRNYEDGEENVVLVGGKFTDQLVKKGQRVDSKTNSSKGSNSNRSSGFGGGMPGGGGIPNRNGMTNGGGMPDGMMPRGDMPFDPRMGDNQSKQIEETEYDLFNDPVSLSFSTFTFRTGNNTLMGPGASMSSSTTSTPKPISVQIVGVLPSGNTDTDDVIFMPREMVLKLIKQKAIHTAKQTGSTPQTTVDTYDSVIVKVIDSDKVPMIQSMIERIGFKTSGAQDTLDEMQNMASSIQLILMGIGAISLIVAAIGITNTMMMSIYERTREIGVMKVIGAVISDIKQMFLVEASIIGFLGGVFGVILCYGISWILNTYCLEFFGDLVGTSTAYKTYVSIIPIELAMASIVFATVIGLLAGYMPAKRATQLSALTAIKTE
ncbi:hypothetical protein CS063_16685 [Sporanaerobium hydrogeniformans]|uniref:Uncharacterized protein n=1 Tax=Sporanaerobium hydrogeniformans TaxID=3072179 RepID=A0AC61D909_9FIRM|nr:ABC transporter permease [Sporanaerobium hydrogeniformans]PHV69266.1 hypothetical protein CS063_16685 [Sporanaerobium hydrogeniformans]